MISSMSSAVMSKAGHDLIFNRKNKENIAAVGKAAENFAKVETYKGLVIEPSISESRDLKEKLKLATATQDEKNIQKMLEDTLIVFRQSKD